LPLVERRPHPTDRRAKLLVLAPEGVDLRERLLELLVEESPLAGLDAQQQVLQSLLEQVITR
jgi:DNA-binding MarR family transcriptional regulator